ncbi:hypothetical protein NIES4101_60830 [Calothrix sp. NIES-4101]|nr:hypothetical protein NIES4101_60830 [Calothrix sp. NIES-4101]
MAETSSASLGLGIVKLIVEGKSKAKESAKQLVNKTRQEVNDAAIQRKVLELIEAILVNKFPNMSREEIKEMLSLELIRGTRFYQELKEEAKEEAKQEVKEEVKQEVKQEVKEEVKLEMVKKLLQRGMGLEEVAEILDVDLEVIRKLANE